MPLVFLPDDLRRFGMYVNIYFKIANDSANRWQDFYAFSKTPFSDAPKGLPVCCGGCLFVNETDIDAFQRLIKSYMRCAKSYLDLKQPKKAPRNWINPIVPKVSKKVYEDWLGRVLSI